MREAIPPLISTPLWCGAQLKHSTGTTLPFAFILIRFNTYKIFTQDLNTVLHKL
jgi:hypothetical protein